jgi:hypothetical protein
VCHVATALTALILNASGCFVFKQSPSGPPRTLTAPRGRIALNVTSHYYLDVVIYALHDGVSTRVGTVTGSSSAVFYLPERLLGQGREIQLLGDPIGSTDFARTEIIIVLVGQYIQWTLAADLRQSSVGVF